MNNQSEIDKAQATYEQNQLCKAEEHSFDKEGE